MGKLITINLNDSFISICECIILSTW